MNTVGELETNDLTAVPIKDVRIVDCGVNSLERKYDLSEELLDQ